MAEHKQTQMVEKETTITVKRPVAQFTFTLTEPELAAMWVIFDRINSIRDEDHELNELFEIISGLVESGEVVLPDTAEVVEWMLENEMDELLGGLFISDEV
jgi:hemerythrin superfamily protein